MRSTPNRARSSIEETFRLESGRILATLARSLGDLDLAEDSLQDALAAALGRWPRDGIPDSPGAWLMVTARNRAIDRLRRERVHAAKVARLESMGASENGRTPAPEEDDDWLSLIFACCHPALPPEGRIALTLRTLGGLSTREIARAFLVPEATLAQRLVRVKRKIKDAGISFKVPPPDLLAGRLESVFAVVYLIFNEGYSATGGDVLIRRELCAEAVRLGRMLAERLPLEPEALGLLSLMLLHDSRRRARTGPGGELVTLEEQDRSLWDASEIEEGTALLDRAIALGRSGPYQVQAAIAALHAQALEASRTDWRQIGALYDALLRLTPTAVVALNRAVAVAMAGSVAEGMALLAEIEASGELAGYHLFYAARADLLRRAGRLAEATESYRQALALCTNPVERRYLERRVREVSDA